MPTPPFHHRFLLPLLFMTSAVAGCGPDSVESSLPVAESGPDASADKAPDGKAPADKAASVFPNEPAGFTTVLINHADQIPATITWSTASAGVWRMFPTPPAVEVSSSTAPCSPPGSWRATYWKGMLAGRGPVTVFSQGTSGKAPESRRWYVRVCIRVGRNGGYENQATGTKLGFLSISDDPAKERCAVIPRIKGDAVQAVKSTWMAEVTFECGGMLPTILFRQLQNLPTGRPIKSDVWQVHEWLVDVGDINQANGSFKWWIDGKLVVDRQGQKFRSSAVTHGVYRWRWSPTWGGVQGVRTRDDDYFVDDVYISGYGKP